MKKLLMLSAIVAVGMTACKSTEDTTNQDQESMTTEPAPFDSTIVEKYWKLITLYGQPVFMSDEQEREAHFILKGNGRINGYAGCNTMNGDYQLRIFHMMLPICHFGGVPIYR